MDRFFISHVPAKDLMVDDRFKMGGQMYQITDVDTNDFGDKVIHFIPWLGNPRRGNMLIVPKKTMFKIYNRKD